MFSTPPSATFNSEGRHCCPSCAAPSNESVVFGTNIYCERCEKKFSLPKRNEFLRLKFRARAAALAASPERNDREAWIALVVVGRLDGTKSADLKSYLKAIGKDEFTISDMMSSSDEYVRAGARAAGRVMFVSGIGAIVLFALVIAACTYFKAAGLIVVPVGLMAVGLVYTLVGLVKWLTGWNIH